MSDLVERLRDPNDPKRFEARLEAAAEIERLRAVIRRLLEFYDDDLPGPWECVKAARKELEGK